MSISYRPIGVIHSPFESIDNVPVQPAAASGIRGTVEVLAEFAPALKDLDGFSHVILLYHLHRVGQTRLTVIPFLDRQPRGLFATRAPCRPNPIGLSVVRLLRVEGNVLEIENVDIIDGTPLLDIKPYVPQFDRIEAERAGWVTAARHRVETTRSDRRFE
jgi:tRNA (adenine37-N6)-methyltransferase